ncbi:MAG: hypothetical protein LBB58_02445, partial [Cellulomonadaceae bacterium]|nr:hypothetical protein [Cellulomonadaceae bacterium]
LHSRLSLQWAITFGGSAGLGLLVLAARLHWDSDRSFQGLMFGAALASVFILWLILGFPQLGARLEVWPLRWLGQKSYGIFLWHWPLLVITLAAFGRRPYASKWWVIALVLASTLAMTALTERLVHAPLHTLGLRGYFRRVWQLPRFARVAIATIAATGLIGTAAAAATAPSQSEITRQILAGAEAASLTRQDAHPVPPHPVPPHVTEPVALPDTAATVPVGAELLDGGLFDQEVAAQAAQVQPPDGVELTAIGDSVLLGAVPQLLEQLPGIYIDGAVSRQFRHALPILADLNEAELLRPYVLIALATNGAVKPEAIDRVLAEIGPDRVALFVTGYGERVWIAESNETLAAAAARYPGQVVLVDWNAAVSADPELLGGDGIHPSVPGMERYAQLVAEALAQTGVAGRD